MLHYFFSFFQTTSFWWNNCSFPVIFNYKKVYFLLFVVDLFWFLHDLRRMLQRVESICYLFVGRIYCCFFAFYQLRRMNIWSATIWICFMTFIIYPCVRFFEIIFNVFQRYSWWDFPRLLMDGGNDETCHETWVLPYLKKI